MRVLSRDETIEVLPWAPLIDAIEDGFRREAASPPRHHHELKNEGARDDILLLMPAWFDEGWGGIKLVNVHPGNSDRGIPAISATYLLFDRKTGRHELILDGGELTARRTAAASALAARKLARPDSDTHLIVGAGRIGSNLPHAFRAALPIKTVIIWDRTEEKGRKLADSLSRDGIEARFEANLESAVGEADIVSCATLATDPIVLGEWLKPGQHLDLIGSFTPHMREADDLALQRARIFIDTDHAIGESGEIARPIASGAINERDICGTLFGLCRGTAKGRLSNQDITLFKGVGLAAEDLSAAILAHERLATS